MIRWFLLFVLVAPAAWADIAWPLPLYDPAGAASPDQAADLVLPMPCNGAMAFQKVDVPVEARNPIDDRAMRLGQSNVDAGYSDYLRPAFLRGAFGDGSEGQSYFFIARYELTVGQYKALTGSCDSDGPRDRIAKGGLSWFDAVELSRTYTEWLLGNAPYALPTAHEQPGFLRLPTEEEWEFATRGGVRIDASAFPARRFFGDANVSDFAMYQGVARGRMAPVGIRKPNPLGLYDVYGNAEELMLEPFRMNAIGRAHGQTGGLVTRGGGFRSLPDQLYSAFRLEYPMYAPSTASPMTSDTFGLRLVISAPITSDDAYLTDIKNAWTAAANGGSANEIDLSDQLTQMIAQEFDPRRKAALEALQLDLRRNRDAARAALQQSGTSTLLSGAIVIGTIERDETRMSRLQFNIGTMTEMARLAPPDRRQRMNGQIQSFVDQLEQMRAVRKGLLLTYRRALETLTADYPPEDLAKAIELLRTELNAGARREESRLLERFVNDLAIYAAAPDMSEDDVLALALSR